MARISDIATTESCKSGKWFEFQAGNNTFSLKLYGKGSYALRETTKILNDLQNRKASSEAIEEASYNLICSAIIDWKGLEDDNGKTLEVTKENKIILLKACNWLVEEISNIARNDRYFLEIKPNDSVKPSEEDSN